jgi:hypothetical protein
MRIPRVVLFLGTAALLFIATAALFGAVASAQTGSTQASPQPVKLTGKVSSVAADSLVLTTRRGDFTVRVSANTWIVVGNNGNRTQASLSDIQANKEATVAGISTTDPKVIDARVITQVASAKGRQGSGAGNTRQKAVQAARHVASGTITAINGATLTLRANSGADLTIQTGSNTVVLNNGFTTVSTLKVGDKVQVLGQPARPANGQKPTVRTINAWGIKVENDTTTVVAGHVASISGNQATLRTPNRKGGLTLNLDASTAYRTVTVAGGQATVSNAAQADVVAGSNLIVEGTLSTDGKTLTARAVVILPAGAGRK